MWKVPENLSYVERLRETAPFGYGKSRVWTRILSVYQRGGCREIRGKALQWCPVTGSKAMDTN